MNAMLAGLLGAGAMGGAGQLFSAMGQPQGRPVTMGEFAGPMGGMMQMDPWQQLASQGAMNANARIPDTAVRFTPDPAAEQMGQEIGMTDDRGGFERLMGDIGGALSAPRRALWSMLGGPESGAQLVANMTGGDASSGLNQGLGFMAEILGDPLSYAGMGAGMLGRLAGRAAGATSAPGRLANILSHEGQGVQSMRGALGMTDDAAARMGGTVMPTATPPLPFAPTAALPEVASTGYNAEQLGSILGASGGDLSAMGAARAAPYNMSRVNPQVSGLLQELGFMDEGGQMAGQLPSWAGVRGGRVMPTPGSEQMMGHLQDITGLTPEFNHLARMRMMQRLQGLQQMPTGSPIPGGY